MTREQRTVARGVKLLDRYRPGWHTRVTQPLNLFSYTHCVLGQVVEPPDTTVPMYLTDKQLRGWKDLAIGIGMSGFFNMRYHGFARLRRKNAEKLIREWNAAIATRNAADRLLAEIETMAPPVERTVEREEVAVA